MYTAANLFGDGNLSGHIDVSGKYTATVSRVEIPYEIFYKAKNLPLP